MPFRQFIDSDYSWRIERTRESGFLFHQLIVEEIECTYMRAAFDKRIRIESRNSDSGHSARACSSHGITPPGAMNLLLRSRPEIAIYPYNLFLPFSELPPGLMLRAQKGNRKRLPFRQLFASAITFHRQWWECWVFCAISPARSSVDTSEVQGELIPN